MKWIHLGHEYFACIDEADYEKVSQYIWRHHPRGYARTHQVYFEGRDIFLHTYLIGAGDDMEVDHLNRAPWDNRRANLRVVEKWQNQQNKGNPMNAPTPTLSEMEEAKRQRASLKQSQNYYSMAAKKNQNLKKRIVTKIDKKVRDCKGNVFPSAVAASKHHGGRHSSNIHRSIREGKVCYGRTWEYVD